MRTALSYKFSARPKINKQRVCGGGEQDFVAVEWALHIHAVSKRERNRSIRYTSYTLPMCDELGYWVVRSFGQRPFQQRNNGFNRRCSTLEESINGKWWMSVCMFVRMRFSKEFANLISFFDAWIIRHKERKIRCHNQVERKADPCLTFIPCTLHTLDFEIG